MSALPRWYKVVTVAAILWNLLGCLAFAHDLSLSAEAIARMPEATQALYAARPGWSVAATGVAVIGGLLGSIGLFLRRRWAFPLLVLSLVGLVVQDIALFILVDGAGLAGGVAVVMQALVLAYAIGLVWLARTGMVRGWLV